MAGTDPATLPAGGGVGTMPPHIRSGWVGYAPRGFIR